MDKEAQMSLKAILGAAVKALQRGDREMASIWLSIAKRNIKHQAGELTAAGLRGVHRTGKRVRIAQRRAGRALRSGARSAARSVVGGGKELAWRTAETAARHPYATTGLVAGGTGAALGHALSGGGGGEELASGPSLAGFLPQSRAGRMALMGLGAGIPAAALALWLLKRRKERKD